MKNNKIKNIIASKKGIDKIAVYFLILLVVVGIIGTIYALFFNNTGCGCISHSNYNTSVSPSPYFYYGDFEEINDRYIKDSVGFNFDLESEKKNSNIVSIDITSYVNEELDWNEVYPYFYQYIENDGRNSCIFRNQGGYASINDDYCLIYYLTPTEIYFHIDNIKELSGKNANNIIEKFLNAIYDGAIFKDIDSIQSFMDASGSESDVLGAQMLMVEFSFLEVKADLMKPVIYLYPEKEIEIDIKLEGVNLTTTYPKYNDGWTVTAYPNGTLIDKNSREYNYLYWEGVSNNFIDMSEGFVVSKDNYIEFLEEKLDYIGLSGKEACDFISYWLPYMNEFEYCLVSFQMENYEEQVKLDFSVKPDNELRLFVAFKGIDNPIEIEEQDLSYYNNFEREGFTVVEWGGTFIN